VGTISRSDGTKIAIHHAEKGSERFSACADRGAGTASARRLSWHPDLSAAPVDATPGTPNARESDDHRR
jgi:hypothetical protein